MFLNKPFSIEQAVAIVNAQKASSILVEGGNGNATI